MSSLLSRRRLVALALPFAAGLGLWLSRPERPTPPSVTVINEGPSASSAFAGGGSASRVTADDPPPPVAPAEPPPVIDGVRVDRTRVCEGEVAFVTVDAHAPSGDDGSLRTLVGTNPGKVAPVRLWRDEGGEASLPDVQVSGPGGVATKPIPRIVVEHCPDRPLAFVEAVPVRNAPEQRKLRVVVRAGAGAGAADGGAPAVRSVLWDFGDGTTTKGAEVLTHEFAPKDEVYAAYLVKATVELEGGVSVVGATGVELLNRAAYERRQGRALVVIRPVERFASAERGESVFTQHFRVRNDEAVPITIDDVVIETSVEGDEGEPRKTSTSPSALLPSATLAPRSETTITVQVNADDPRGLVYRSYLLKGKAGDGRLAEGALTVMVPTNTASAKNATAAPPALEARIKRARAILHKDLVTFADLDRLETQGHFYDLPPRTEGMEAPTTPP